MSSEPNRLASSDADASDDANVESIASLMADLTVTLNSNRIVEDVTVRDDSSAMAVAHAWQGQLFEAVLTEESAPKFAGRIAAISDGETGVSARIELNHSDHGMGETPVSYTVFRAQDREGFVLIGRDLRPVAELQDRLVKTQQALERDYETRRDLETRYRALLDASGEAFFMIDVASRRIVDVNSAAKDALGLKSGVVEDATVAAAFSWDGDGSLLDRLTGSSTGIDGSARGVRVSLVKTGAEAVLEPKAFRSGGQVMVLCRVITDEQTANRQNPTSEALDTLFAHGADAMIILDDRGRIQDANTAFLALTDRSSLAAVEGAHFADFLVRGETDLQILMKNARRGRRVRSFQTDIRTAFGSQRPVDIAATALDQDAMAGFALILRDEEGRRVAGETSPPISDAELCDVANMVGDLSLRDLVSATTDVVEKICIQTALRMTGNNRAAAATMLGLSRQSLYVKMRKFGIGPRSEH